MHTRFIISWLLSGAVLLTLFAVVAHGAQAGDGHHTVVPANAIQRGAAA